VRLTKLVPALALVAAVAAPSAAVELADGALTISGEVEFQTVLSSTDTGPADSSSFDMDHEFDLDFTYRVTDSVEAGIEFESSGKSDITLDAAYITWGFHDNLSLTAGKFGGWIGNVDMAIAGTDYLDGLSGSSVDAGIQLDAEYAIDESSSISAFFGLAEGMYSDGEGPRQDPAAGFGVTYSNDAFGSLGFSFTIDHEEDDGGEDADENPNVDAVETYLYLFADIDVVEDLAFGVGAGFYEQDLEAAGANGTETFAATAYVSYTGLDVGFPNELILQLSMQDEDNGTTSLTDTAFTTTWFFNPTGDDNFSFGLEAGYETDERTGNDADMLHAAFTMTASIP
jgi:hypothetical protein